MIDEINQYKDTYGDWPKALIIDVPRDEETKNLHEIYGVLEKLNDGVITSNFGGRRKSLRMDIGIPIIIFTNSAPIQGALSLDRWDILALHKVKMRIVTDVTIKDEEDYYLFQAESESWIVAHTSSTVTWQNKITTTAPKPTERKSDGTRFESDTMFREMFLNHRENIKKYPALVSQEWIENPIDGSRVRTNSNGVVECYGSERASVIAKAPEPVIKWFTHVRKNINKKVV